MLGVMVLMDRLAPGGKSPSKANHSGSGNRQANQQDDNTFVLSIPGLVQPSLGLEIANLGGIVVVDQSDRTTATAINWGKGVQFLSFEIIFLIAVRQVRRHTDCLFDFLWGLEEVVEKMCFRMS